MPLLRRSNRHYALMVVDDPKEWTWRQRLRDPRFPGLLAVGLAGALLGAAIFGFSWMPLVLCLLVVAAVGLLVLPRWQDQKHGPRAGAGVLYAGATLTVLLALVIGI